MTLDINSREVDGVTILDLSGRITLNEGSIKLRDTVRTLLAQNKKNIVLNMSDVTYSDSSGFGELVAAFTTTTNLGGNLKLMKLNERPEAEQPIRTLRQIRLYTVFDHFDDEVEAVASFSAAPIADRKRLILAQAGQKAPIGQPT